MVPVPFVNDLGCRTLQLANGVRTVLYAGSGPIHLGISHRGILRGHYLLPLALRARFPTAYERRTRLFPTRYEKLEV